MITEIQEQLRKLPEGAKAEIHITPSKAALIVKRDYSHGLASEDVVDANLRIETGHLVKSLLQMDDRHFGSPGDDGPLGAAGITPIDETQHLLICLMEEAAEIAHRTAKAIRFGLDDTDPTIAGSPTERIRISSELDDLTAVREMLEERGILKRNNSEEEAKANKKAKVLHFMGYARTAGTLR